MTLGAGTYFPHAGFAFPRSYLAGVWIVLNPGSSVTWTDNFALAADVGGTVTAGIEIAENIFPWSSNAYTLDHLITQSWYKVAPSPTEIPLPFNLTWFTDPVSTFPYVVYEPFGETNTGNFKHLLPFAPADYWGPHFDLTFS